MDWATFWAIFKQINLVTLVENIFGLHSSDASKQWINSWLNYGRSVGMAEMF
jgi:hypothetical protein